MKNIPELAPFRNGNLLPRCTLPPGTIPPDRPDDTPQPPGYPDEWRANTPWTGPLGCRDVLQRDGETRFVWRDQPGARYPMFADDMMDVIKTGIGVNGNVLGRTWVVVRRGSDYGIALWQEE